MVEEKKEAAPKEEPKAEPKAEPKLDKTELRIADLEKKVSELMLHNFGRC